MNSPFNASNIILVDATGETLKTALFQESKIVATPDTCGQPMESFFQNIAEICQNISISEIGEFFLCTGTGSILGTRTASVATSTIANFSNAKIFEWNCMQTAAYAIADKGENKFSILTPSRKGFANLLNFDYTITFFEEIPIEQVQDNALARKISLFQRSKVPLIFSEFEQFNLDAQTAFETLKKHPDLLSACTEAPEAKSLTKREYVKWKAQAHI